MLNQNMITLTEIFDYNILYGFPGYFSFRWEVTPLTWPALFTLTLEALPKRKHENVARYKKLAFLRKYAHFLCCGSGSAWIRIILGSRIRIRIRVKSRIRNHNESHESQEQDPEPDLHQSKNSGAVEAQNWAMEGRGHLSSGGVEAQNRAVVDL